MLRSHSACACRGRIRMRPGSFLSSLFGTQSRGPSNCLTGCARVHAALPFRPSPLFVCTSALGADHTDVRAGPAWFRKRTACCSKSSTLERLRTSSGPHKHEDSVSQGNKRTCTSWPIDLTEVAHAAAAPDRSAMHSRRPRSFTGFRVWPWLAPPIPRDGHDPSKALQFAGYTDEIVHTVPHVPQYARPGFAGLPVHVNGNLHRAWFGPIRHLHMAGGGGGSWVGVPSPILLMLLLRLLLLLFSTEASEAPMTRRAVWSASWSSSARSFA